MNDYDPRYDDPLLAIIDGILKDDIPDPNRRRAVAGMIHAHAKVSTVHSLRGIFEPYLGMNAVRPTVEEALTAMRGAVVRLSGFTRDERKEDSGG